MRLLGHLRSKKKMRMIQQTEVHLLHPVTDPRLEKLKKEFYNLHRHRKFLPSIKKYDCAIIEFGELCLKASQIYKEIGQAILMREITSSFENMQ